MEPTNKITLQSSDEVETLTDFENLLRTSAFLYESWEEQGKSSEVKLERELPLFYTKPIYVAKDYDQL